MMYWGRASVLLDPSAIGCGRSGGGALWAGLVPGEGACKSPWPPLSQQPESPQKGHLAEHDSICDTAPLCEGGWREQYAKVMKV